MCTWSVSEALLAVIDLALLSRGSWSNVKGGHYFYGLGVLQVPLPVMSAVFGSAVTPAEGKFLCHSSNTSFYDALYVLSKVGPPAFRGVEQSSYSVAFVVP